VSDLDALQSRWAEEERKWHYVLATFWALDYEQMVQKLALFASLDEAVEQANRERDGMVAT
jgi:hypothetical protein